MIGLAGAHRTGKSTLAREFSQRSRVPLVLTTASATFKRLGADPSLDYVFDDTLTIHEEILSDLTEQWQNGGNFFVTDRTPIDVYAYLTCSIQRQTLTADMERSLSRFKSRCLSVSEAFFKLYYVLQPGIKLVYEEGKAPLSVGYIDHLSDVIVGAAITTFSADVVDICPRYKVELYDRLHDLTRLTAKYADRRYVNSPSSQVRLT